MSEATFRIIVSVSVALAVIAFLVQAAVVFAIYGVIREMSREGGRFLARLQSTVRRSAPIFGELDECVEKIELSIDSLTAMATQVGSVLDRAKPLIGRSVVAWHQAEVLGRSVVQVAGTGQQAVRQLHGEIAVIVGDVRGIVQTVKVQIEYVRSLVQDADVLVRGPLERVNRAAAQTSQSFESVTNAALSPLHVVKRIVAGLSAGAAALVQPSRRRPTAPPFDEHEAPGGQESNPPHKPDLTAA